MDFLSNYICAICCIGLVSLLFVWWGGSILLNSPVSSYFSSNSRTPFFFISTSYFVGMALFLSTLIIVDKILPTIILTFYSTLLILTIICVCLKPENAFQNLQIFYKFYATYKVKLLLLFFGIFLTVTFFWLNPTDEQKLSTDVLQCFGSLHTLRYISISKYIFLNHHIPALSQNYGQSILASIPYFFSIKTPVLNLLLWLIMTMFYLILLTYGIFKNFDLQRKYAILATFIVMFGSYSFSLSYIGLIDSGNPFLFNGYADTLYGIGSFVVMVWALYTFVLHHSATLKNSILVLFLWGCFTISWAFTAPQNIVLYTMILLVLNVVVLVTHHRNRNQLRIYSILFFVALSIGILQGGMFTPKSRITNTDIIGVMKPMTQEKSLLKIQIGLAHFHGLDTILFENENIISMKNALKNKNSNIEIFKGLFNECYYKFEKKIWDTIRIIFWPLLGLISIAFYLIKKKSIFFWSCIGDLDERDAFIRYIWYITLLCFIAGFTANFFISFSGYKWELTRFLIPFYYFSMVILGLWGTSVLKLNKSIFGSLVAFIAIVIMFFGPMTHLCFKIKHHSTCSPYKYLKLLSTFKG